MHSPVSQISFKDIAMESPETARQLIRIGRYQGPTSGLMPGKLQCNLVILQGRAAKDFEEFCRLNPKSCPLAGQSEMGSPHIQNIGNSIDVTRDAALYNIYEKGELKSQSPDVSRFWQDDMTAFAIGCSFTFENALEKQGIAMRHIEMGVTVPMFKSNIMTEQAGYFSGQMVVSMRPIPENQLETVYEICKQYPIAHGVPVQIGSPESLGIKNIQNPDWGNPVPVNSGEQPVFWACGVTPQVAIMNAKPKFAITHAPGAMLIADVAETSSPIYNYQEESYQKLWRNS